MTKILTFGLLTSQIHAQINFLERFKTNQAVNNFRDDEQPVYEPEYTEYSEYVDYNEVADAGLSLLSDSDENTEETVDISSGTDYAYLSYESPESNEYQIVGLEEDGSNIEDSL